MQRGFENVWEFSFSLFCFYLIINSSHFSDWELGQPMGGALNRFTHFENNNVDRLISFLHPNNFRLSFYTMQNFLLQNLCSLFIVAMQNFHKSLIPSRSLSFIGQQIHFNFLRMFELSQFKQEGKVFKYSFLSYKSAISVQ